MLYIMEHAPALVIVCALNCMCSLFSLGLLSDTSVRCSGTILEIFANYLKTELAYSEEFGR